MADVQLLRVQEVGATLHPSAAETRAPAAGSGRLAAHCHQNDEPQQLRSNNALERDPFRSPSPEFVDAFSEPQQWELGTMGETASRTDTNEVEGGRVEGVQRLALPRDANITNSSSSDLGIGIRVAGGVKCEKCGDLHTVITDVLAGDLLPEANLYKGLAVVEWCGHSVDGASYEEVRSVMAKTEKETSIELAVKECRGPSQEAEEKEPLSTDKVESQVLDLTSSPQHSPSSSTDREPSYTPKSLSPTPSPLHSRTCTPFHSASSTPSPTPPPSPNLPRRGPTKKQILDPRPASISLPVSRPQGEVVVTPKFMINDVPTSPPPQEAGPSKKFTVESFLGKTPAASIHMSLRYREDENHLRILLHEVKQAKKKGSKSSTMAQGHYFINAYLFPDQEKQGVRSCEVLSHVSDLENPQFYTISRQQLNSVALRVVLWEAKSAKHPSFVGEVLVSLSDRIAVKLEGHPSWFTMCRTDPNLPPPPAPTLVSKRPKKEDIFHRVRRGTGYALQSLRRPMSMGIDALAAENGRISPSASMDSLESSLKKLQGANVTMPRRTRKDRKPLSALFFSPPHVPGPPVENRAGINGHETPRHIGNFSLVDENASLSVPTSPLLSRRAARDTSIARRKKLGGILNVLRGSLLPTMHSLDLSSPQRKRAATEADMTDGEMTEGEEQKRRWSLSGDVKHRIFPNSPPLSPSPAPFFSPQHTRRQPLVSTKSSSSLDPTLATAHRRVHSAIAGTSDFQWTDAADLGQALESRGSATDLLAPEKSSVLLSDGSWYSAEEDLKDKETSKHIIAPQNGAAGASKLLYSRSHTGTENSKGVIPAANLKSRSAENLLERLEADEEEEGEGGRVHLPLTRTRCCALSRGSSGSSVEEEYATANSRPLSGASGSDELDGDVSGESSLDSSTRLKAIGRANALSSSPKLRAISMTTASEEASREGVASSGERISRWRSLEDLLGALPLKKRRPRWLRRNRTHHVSSNSSPSPLLKRRSSEPAFSQSAPVGKVRLELSYNPETSMVGVRLHEHTLTENRTDLTVQTYLYSRVSLDSKECQQNIISFKKTDYSHTLVASFTCDSNITDLSLQVSMETSGRFFSRHSGHIILDLGPLLPSPAFSCDQWFPLFHTPCYPPINTHHQET